MIKHSKSFRCFQYVFAVVVTIFFLAPLYWLFISSISYRDDLITTPLKFIPPAVTFSRYVDVFANADNEMAYVFRKAMENSMIVSISVTMLALIVGNLAAYAFARLRFPFRKHLIYLFLFTYMIPPIVIVIPLYLILDSLKMLDQKLTLVLLYSSSVIPFVIWIMQSYFKSISREYEQAAEIDGCTKSQTLWYIILPIVRAGLVSTGILAFLIAWDEFFLSLIFTSTLNAKTISVAIAEFTGKHTIDYGMIATGGVIASLPPLIIAAVFQKYLIQGMTASGGTE